MRAVPSPATEQDDRAAGTVLVDNDVAEAPAEAVTGAGPEAGPEVSQDAVTETPAEAVPELPAPEVEAAAAAAPAPGTAPTAAPARRPRGTGAREAKRQRTRETIVDAAGDLFAERGFDQVSVVEIAQRAGVVEKTVFNHFPVKEGLVFESDPPIRAALVDAVRHRGRGGSAVAAAGSFVVAAVSQLGSPAASAGVAEMARVIRGSRTLVVREREILATLTEALAAEIGRETGAGSGDLEPWLAAHAVVGLYAALLQLARDRALAGVSGPDTVAELRAAGARGLALLGAGLDGYARRD